MATSWRCGALLAMLLVLIACSGRAPNSTGAASPSGDFHADLAGFLARHVGPAGRIDYAAAVGDRPDLDRAIDRLREHSPDSDPTAFATREQQLAYWINAYNAWAIRIVLDHYPVASVNEVKPPLLLRFLPQGAGFFYLQRIELGGRRTNLYDLENGLVRKRFAEPRIHFALNCASLGCPVLPREPFEAARLEAQLARETQRFLSDERKLRIDFEQRVVRLSAIFDWYERDFTDWVASERPDLPATLVSWLANHLPEAAARDLAACADCRLEFLPYDWSLNDSSDRPARP